MRLSLSRRINQQVPRIHPALAVMQAPKLVHLPHCQLIPEPALNNIDYNRSMFGHELSLWSRSISSGPNPGMINHH